MHCRICDSQDFELAVDLQKQPWGNHFLRKEELGQEPYYPLRLVYCMKCQAAQLDYTIPKEIMFSNHTYLSGITQSLRDHFQRTSNEVDRRFFKNQDKKRVLDIGSNDGTQLVYYRNLGYEIVGVESSERIAAMANNNGIPTINAFFNLTSAQEIHDPFDVINASGIFFHLEELHSVTAAIKKLLKKDGVFVVQFLYMKNILEIVAFDQIYHEHLLYYTLKTLQTLLQQHGLSLFDAYLSPIHGGSMIGFVSHDHARKTSRRLHRLYQEENLSGCNELDAYHRFVKKIDQLKHTNIEFLQKAKMQGKRVFGMGSPVKGNTLLNSLKINKDLIECLVEKNQLRKGLYSPGSHLEIVMEDEINKPPDIYYVLAWNFKNEILKNNKELIKNGVEFYFPIPAQ